MTRRLDAQGQLDLAADIVKRAKSAGVDNGAVPHDAIQNAFLKYKIPWNGVGEIFAGDAAPTELDAFVARRIDSVKKQLSKIREWQSMYEHDGEYDVIERGNWYNKLSPDMQNDVARAIVIDGLTSKYSGAIRFGIMSDDTATRILSEHGYDVEVPVDLQAYPYELPQNMEGGTSSWNSVQLLLEERTKYVMRQLEKIPELADAGKRRRVASMISFNSLLDIKSDGIVSKHEVIDAMSASNIDHANAAEVRLYPTAGEEAFFEFVDGRELLTAELSHMPEFKYYSRDELSVEARSYMSRWKALTQSERAAAAGKLQLSLEENCIPPRDWIKSERLVRVAEKMESAYHVKTARLVSRLREHSADTLALERHWARLTPRERARFKGGIAEFQITALASFDSFFEPNPNLPSLKEDSFWEDRIDMMRREGRLDPRQVFHPVIAP